MLCKRCLNLSGEYINPIKPDTLQELRSFKGGGIAMRRKLAAGNAAGIFGVSNVDGALAGGASLKTDDFPGIIQELETA